LRISKKVLLNSLEKLVGIVKPKQILPILSNCLLDSSKGVYLTDLSVSAIATFEEEVEDSGFKCLLPFSKLHSIVKYLPEGDIQFSFQGSNSIRMVCGSSSFEFATVRIEEYPSFPDVRDDGVLLPISLSQLEVALSKLSCFVVRKSYNGLDGILFCIKDGNLSIVASDGHRLGEVKIQASGVQDCRFLLALKDVRFITKLFNGNDIICLRVAGNVVDIHLGDRLQLRCMAFDFPEHSSLFPGSSGGSMVFDKAELLQAVSVIKPLCSELFNSIRMVIKGNECHLMAEDGSSCSGSTRIPCMCQQDIAFSFNVTYLQDILRCLSSDDATFSFTTERDIVLLEDADDSYLIMPLS